MTQASTGGVTLKRGDGATPSEVFTLVPEMILAPVLGADFGEIEVTSYDSVGLKEFISEKLGTGKDVEVEWNLILGDPNQALVKADIDGGITSNYQMTITDGTKTMTSTFALTPKGWSRNTSFTEQHKLSAMFKISGAITDVVV